MAKTTDTIKDFYGRIIGRIETQNNGDKLAKDFYGRIVGKYYKNRNVTTDFYGRILAQGDSIIQTLYKNEYTK